MPAAFDMAGFLFVGSIFSAAVVWLVGHIVDRALSAGGR